MAKKIKRLGNGLGRPTKDVGPDRGTAHVQGRREWFVADRTRELSVFPLGVMYANDVIDAETYEAGCRYAWIYEVRYGRTSAAAQNYGDRPENGPKDMSEEALQAIRDELHRAYVALDAIPRACKDELDNVVVYGRFPAWLLPTAPKPAHLRDHAKLMTALHVVGMALGFKARRAA